MLQIFRSPSHLKQVVASVNFSTLPINVRVWQRWKIFQVLLQISTGRSCAVVSCSRMVPWITGSLGKSLFLLLCFLVYHRLNYSWPKVPPATIVDCIQLKSVNSFGVKINCRFWQTNSLLPRIYWLCAEQHHRLQAPSPSPETGVGSLGKSQWIV